MEKKDGRWRWNSGSKWDREAEGGLKLAWVRLAWLGLGGQMVEWTEYTQEDCLFYASLIGDSSRHRLPSFLLLRFLFTSSSFSPHLSLIFVTSFVLIIFSASLSSFSLHISPVSHFPPPSPRPPLSQPPPPGPFVVLLLVIKSFSFIPTLSFLLLSKYLFFPATLWA